MLRDERFERRREDIQVSIIIPVYNIEKYIKKCVKSLLEQTYQNFEIIIINDGSTDRSGEICEQCKECDSRIKVIHKNNTGVSEARNIGIQKAQGDFIVFVDGDDYVSGDYISILLEGILIDNVDLFCADFFIVNEGNAVTHSLNTNESIVLSRNQAIDMLGDKRYFQGYLWNKIFIRQVILDNNIFFHKDIKIWEDMLFCLEYIKCINRIGYIKKPIYYYVQRDYSAVNSPNTWLSFGYLDSIKLIWEEIQFHNGEFKEYIRNFYANALVGSLGKTESDKKKIKKQIKCLKEINGRLTVKHTVKLWLFKIKTLFQK